MQYGDVHEASHELDAPPWLRVESTLISVARLVRDAYDSRFAALELNLTQASILAYVGDFGPVIQTRIADHLQQGRAATGASIDYLQNLGVIDRLPDPDDRRVWRIGLTETGQRMVNQIGAIDERLRTELRDGISKTERQALNATLSRLKSNLQQALSNPSQGDQP
jgi:MarR family transcriptional regulator, transcriptional regulator for hemolysin